MWGRASAFAKATADSQKPWRRRLALRRHLWGRALGLHRCSPKGLPHIGLVTLLLVLLPPSAAHAQDTARDAESCSAWADCQALALEAESRGDFETFHDLAWRTMQTRAAQDPDVMLMLARAQSRSGRPHDALVMLRRITELGVPPAEALTSDAFARVRALRDWPQVQAFIAGTAAPPGAPSTTPRDTGLSPEAGSSRSRGPDRARSPNAPQPSPDSTRSPDAAATIANQPAPRIGGTPAAATPSSAWAPENLMAVGVQGMIPAGLAYDAASGRVLVGNRTGRSVITISERLKTSMDLVRAASAGFHEVLALAIDARRGDLWVASAAPEGSSPGSAPGAALHKLQLVSGRPLETVPIDAGDRPARFCGVAVTPNGMVFALDAAGARLWRLAPGERRPSLVRTLDVQNPAGLALDESGRYAYVSHDNGLARLTLADGSLTAITAAEDVNLAAFEAIVWHNGSLIALQRQGDAAFRLVRLRLNGRGTSIARVDVLDPEVSTCGGPSAATTSGADVYYLAADSMRASGGAASARTENCSLFVRRLRIK
jgi:hypothetical protein